LQLFNHFLYTFKVLLALLYIFGNEILITGITTVVGIE